MGQSHLYLDSVLDDACTSQFFGENIPILAYIAAKVPIGRIVGQWSALNGRGQYETSDHRGGGGDGGLVALPEGAVSVPGGIIIITSRRLQGYFLD